MLYINKANKNFIEQSEKKITTKHENLQFKQQLFNISNIMLKEIERCNCSCYYLWVNIKENIFSVITVFFTNKRIYLFLYIF